MQFKLFTVFDKEGLELKLKELEKEEQNPEIYKDFEKMKQVGVQKKSVTLILEKINGVNGELQDLKEMYELLESENASEDEWKVFEKDVKKLSKEIDSLYIETLYSGENDMCSALVELHSGAGGEEAQDWTDMLHRMYLRYAEKQGYSAKVVNYLYGDGAGYKSVTLLIEGEHAYGNLKCERGVHRLVRISPFDANKRRHTSFASVEVSPIIEETNSIEIRPEDIKVDTFRSGGAGGQHINKTESAVRITHIPTGIIVACQNERSQTQNKEFAMKMLYAKLAEKREREKEAERQAKLGLQMKIEWGSQIRSYVLCPYTMVKDHRTNFEVGDADAVLDGEIQPFINAKLKFDKSNEKLN
ncbi:MAG: peptide chain release factor 2 [Clostridia bacterium]|nr:peptide chain release factor 2 [Clostridia bacterium]